MAIPVAALVAGGGAAANLLGGVFGSQAARREQKRMRQFLERIYNEYVSSPLYKSTRDFALSLLREGDYKNIYYGAYQQALARNRANLLGAQQQMESAAARGGLLRSGQQQALLNDVRQAAFGADRGATQDYAANQFAGKQYGAQLAESLAKGPFQAGLAVANSGMFNPALQAQAWQPLTDLGTMAGNLGFNLLGQQNIGAQGRGLLGTPQMYNPQQFQLGQQYQYFPEIKYGNYGL